MRCNLRTEVNCESCDHYLYMVDKDGDVRGTTCEHDYETSDTEYLPLHELTCHSLYELWEMHEEAIGDARREESAL